MAQTKFDEFVKREHQAFTDASDKPIDWAAERDEWLKYLNALYAQVEEFLKEYVQADQVSIRYDNVQLNEDYIGRYTARQMTLTIGRKTIWLEPVGTLLIGTKGRVDLVGPFGRVPLMLLSKQLKNLGEMFKVSVSVGSKQLSPPIAQLQEKITWIWRIVSKVPQGEIIELNRDSFLNLLTEIANG